jgi:tetratricopeptide (TPR) repeat protein
MRIEVAGLVLLPVLMLTSAAGARGPAAERWLQARSTHFVVLTDSSEKDARRLACEFERMHLVFHTLFPTKGDDSDPPIVVVALKDRKGMQSLEPEAYLGKGRIDLSGFFLRAEDKNYILVRLDAPEEHAFANVYHEYTHYMLRKAEWLPLWLNEGLAQFYENTDIDGKNAWVGQANAKELRLLNRNDLLPIATLLAIDVRSPYYHEEEKGSIFYAESWALTHFLIVSDRLQGTHRMRDYSEALAQGADAVAAAQHAFGDLDRLQQALGEYVAQQKFMYFMMPAALTAREAALDVRPVSTAEADAVRADVLLYTRRTSEAQTLLDAVLRDDPGVALAHETMGNLRYREGDVAGAKRWFREAVDLNSQSYLAHYYYAAMALRSQSVGEDEAIEASLRKSIALNPEFAPAYDALAMFYAARHRKLDEAQMLIVRAIELEPSQLIHRLNCSEVLAEQRQYADALDVLQESMHVARTQIEIETVQDRIARVERFQTAMYRTVGQGG